MWGNIPYLTSGTGDTVMRRIFLPALSLLLLGAGIWLFIPKYNINQNIGKSTFILNPGTALATPVISLESYKPGPCILILGGIHGDEPAGTQACLELAEGPTPPQGRLLLIPAANPPALAVQKRYSPLDSDLNRSFASGEAKGNTAVMRSSLWTILHKERVDWVIDLHEAQGFYREGKNTVGQTLIFSPAPAAVDLVIDILDYINRQLDPGLRFTYLSPPKDGSLIQEAYKQLSIPGLIVETCKEQELAVRVAQHRLVVESIVATLLEE